MIVLQSTEYVERDNCQILDSEAGNHPSYPALSLLKADQR